MENNILEKALVDILQKATAGVEKGVDFLHAEIPVVIEQLLMWHMWSSIITNLIWLTICIILYIVVYKFYKRGNLKNDIDYYLGGSAICIVTTIILLCVIFNTTWLQILIAPKVYLIEYAAGLSKGLPK